MNANEHKLESPHAATHVSLINIMLSASAFTLQVHDYGDSYFTFEFGPSVGFLRSASASSVKYHSTSHKIIANTVSTIIHSEPSCHTVDVMAILFRVRLRHVRFMSRFPVRATPSGRSDSPCARDSAETADPLLVATRRAPTAPSASPRPPRDRPSPRPSERCPSRGGGGGPSAR